MFELHIKLYTNDKLNHISLIFLSTHILMYTIEKNFFFMLYVSNSRLKLNVNNWTKKESSALFPIEFFLSFDFFFLIFNTLCFILEAISIRSIRVIRFY